MSEERLANLERQFDQLIQHTLDEATVASATYAVNKHLLSSLIIALRLTGTDLSALSAIFFEAVSATEIELEEDKRDVFMHEASAWLDLLNAQ